VHWACIGTGIRENPGAVWFRTTQKQQSNKKTKSHNLRFMPYIKQKSSDSIITKQDMFSDSSDDDSLEKGMLGRGMRVANKKKAAEEDDGTDNRNGTAAKPGLSKACSQGQLLIRLVESGQFGPDKKPSDLYTSQWRPMFKHYNSGQIRTFLSRIRRGEFSTAGVPRGSTTATASATVADAVGSTKRHSHIDDGPKKKKSGK